MTKAARRRRGLLQGAFESQNGGPEDEHEAQEGGVAADSLQPVVVDVEQHHLGLCGLQDEVPKLLHLQSCLLPDISNSTSFC